MKKIKFSIALIFILILSLLVSCNDSESNNLETEGTSKISVRLMDMPGDFENVYVDIKDVMIKLEDDGNDNVGWVSVDAVNTGVYDLLELTGGIDVLLLDDFELPSGPLNQIRLIIGNDNSVVINGESFPLNTPSALQSGLKIKVDQDLLPNISYTFLLDFNVDESIITAGNSNNILLKPVIRSSVEAESGYITGAISPQGFQVLVEVTDGVETISAYADQNGDFIIVGLNEGTYTVTVIPDTDSGYATQVFENINITIGESTNMGNITFE